jgi:GntR family transcriptional regulator
MHRLRLEFKAGVPIYEQLLYAARKAIVGGEFAIGEPFPSVRALSAGLRINPNTVHKALTALKDAGLIETVPGIGHRVAVVPEGSAKARASLLGPESEALVLRARELGLSRKELIAAINNHWDIL